MLRMTVQLEDFSFTVYEEIEIFKDIVSYDNLLRLHKKMAIRLIEPIYQEFIARKLKEEKEIN